MKKIRYLLLPIFLIGIFLTACKKDFLNEEDLLELTSESSFSILVVDQNTLFPINGATVKIGASGEVLDDTTDSAGMVHFYDLNQQENVKVTIKKQDYFDYNNLVDLNFSSRSVGEHLTIYLSSRDNAAVIKGVVSIQTNLTTPELEHPEGIPIKVLSDYDNEILASTTTNTNGEYELQIPVGTGEYVVMNFPTLKYDQVLKVRDTSNTVVSTIARGTIFNPYKPAEALPNTSNIIATVEDPYYSVNSEYWPASIDSLTVVAGVITGVEFGDLGQGYDEWFSFDINIVSLEGGSGDDIEVSGDFIYIMVYYPIDPSSLSIFSGGSGYPVYEPNENTYTMSPTGFKWPGSYGWENFVDSNNEYLTPGEVIVLDVNYGTGTTIGEIPVEY